MDQPPFLKPERDQATNLLTGDFRCSYCGTIFHPELNMTRMLAAFTAHKMHAHPDAPKSTAPFSSPL
ncbi:hypothetical protein [Occallatibacter savannae]|uniref:hypothetical protein n=1 Tax=Occallatibacter savannae TaxID=1002691 RepID=UPI0013A55F3C|nr:hypothetical protein [Occallatibacter savannae]